MAQPTISEAGDVTSSNLSAMTEHPDAFGGMYGESYLFEGQISQIYAVDDPQNDETGLPGSFTLYDVLARSPDGGTETFNRCRMLQPGFGGSINNFLEVLPVDPGPFAKEGKNSILKRGTRVLVGFISGQRNSPVILGALPHQSRPAVAARPGKAEGATVHGEYQGLNFKIQNDGALVVTFNGPKNDLGELVNSNGPTQIKIDASGNFSVSTNAQQSVEVNRVNKTITVTNSSEQTIVMEQDGNKITINCKDANINTLGDTVINSTGKTIVNSEDEAIINSETMIKLQKGDAVPTEPFILGAEFVKFTEAFLKILINGTTTGSFSDPLPMSDQTKSQLTSLLRSPISDKKILSKHIIGVK